jgi:hypothetical protein
VINETSTDKLARMLDKARKLLARADHENTPVAEADLARQQAAKLIERYRLDEAELMESGELALTPGFLVVDLCRSNSEFRNHYYDLAMSVVKYLDLEQTTMWQRVDDEGFYLLSIELVGFESDLAIANLLITECVSAFGSNLEPKYDPADSFEANAWRLRAGGWERNRIARVMFGGWTTENEMKAQTRRVTKLIRQHAERTGQDADTLLGRGNDIKGYRLSFANSFASTIRLRTWSMAQERSEEGGIVFADRKERIMEALYVRYPNRRPKPNAGELDGTFSASKCAKCLRAKSGACRQHAVRYTSRTSGPRYSSAGAARGRSAASSVNLGSATSGKIGR